MKKGSSLAEIEELAAQLPLPEQLKLAARICERLSTRGKTEKEARREQLAWLRECDQVAKGIPGRFDSAQDLRRARPRKQKPA